jgi:hypothetical protein
MLFVMSNLYSSRLRQPAYPIKIMGVKIRGVGTGGAGGGAAGGKCPFSGSKVTFACVKNVIKIGLLKT